ncbi:hypothetical protein M426DRAFT_317824 [Hypoxylon sp. CI-4A]|nr:hypothetical protein M426DRAFT_317824 [Hypoxylon sp. CI-4A]
MNQHLEDIEAGRIDPSQQDHTLIRPRSKLSFSRLPQISPERLALASPDSPDDASALTVLYLAYGANLSETFLHQHDIIPLSSTNVSAPAFDITFDLPGIPYWEPCFSNVTPRKIPIPGDPPKPPFPPPTTTTTTTTTNNTSYAPHDSHPVAKSDAALTGTSILPSLPPDGPPSWNKGLYGVVYELVRGDYYKIIRREGGGAAYQEILAPCLALPPPFHVPEKPPFPELPKPFMARTLYAPRLPSLKPPGDGAGSKVGSGSYSETVGATDDGDDGDDPRDKKWWQKLLLPVRRPANYAQPSGRYLQLIRDGAHEHYLPEDYQHYLTRLQTYKITTWRQDIGRWLLLLVISPFIVVGATLSFIYTEKDGKLPKWLTAASNVFNNLVWKAYDAVFKPIFGDGERTVENDPDEVRRRDRSRIRNMHASGSDKSRLLSDW